MDSLKNQIIELQKVSKTLEPTENERDHLLNKIKAFSNNFINTIDDLKTYKGGREEKGVFKIGKNTKSIDEILKLYTENISEKGIKPASGGHIGYIPGGGLYTSSLADYIADVTNEYSGMYFASPGGVAMENELIDWMKTLFGFPSSAVGNLASGGSISNLIALTAARDKYKIKNEKIQNSVIYMSPQVHHCIHKALRIIGLEDVNVNYVELDENSKIITKDLEKKIDQDKKNGLHPYLIIASAGTTDTGAIDPLKSIAAIAKMNDMWFHVDAAYGGFFILIDEIKSKFEGVELADSIVIDPHKGLFLPYGLGAVLIKDKKAVYHSHHYRANYMQDAINDSLPVNPADVSPELTKHFRGFRMWLPLMLHGIEPFKACLKEKLLLTLYFRDQLKTIGFKLGPDPDLSVSYFWYPTNDSNENAFNEKLMEAIHNDGEIFLSSTRINGKFVIRIAILSFRTKLETIDRAVKMIKKALKSLGY